jgi:hypothetical protein
MLKLPSPVTAVTSVIITLTTGSAVAQKAPPELPLAVICWNEKTQTWRTGYLHTIKEDGTATYLAPSGQLSNTLNAERVVQPPSDRPAASDCYGKTLDQLRAMGRLIEFQRTR